MVRKHVLNIVSPQEPQTQTITRSQSLLLEHLSRKAPTRPSAGARVGTGSPRGWREHPPDSGSAQGDVRPRGARRPAGKGESPHPGIHPSGTSLSATVHGASE